VAVVSCANSSRDEAGVAADGSGFADVKIVVVDIVAQN
jgi:hypothetical protein